MGGQQNNNPLHGVTLENIVTSLVEHYGWEELGKRINIRCFTSDPSVKSSLKFLRRTDWARTRVENLYLATQKSVWQKSKEKGNEKRNQEQTGYSVCNC